MFDGCSNCWEALRGEWGRCGGNVMSFGEGDLEVGLKYCQELQSIVLC